jgi:hypothetical protein
MLMKLGPDLKRTTLTTTTDIIDKKRTDNEKSDKPKQHQ